MDTERHLIGAEYNCKLKAGSVPWHSRFFMRSSPGQLELRVPLAYVVPSKDKNILTRTFIIK